MQKRKSREPFRSLILALSVVLAILMSGCASPATTPEPAPSLPLEDCQLTTAGMRTSIPARCGTLSVPEDPEDPEGRHITLYVAVIPAVSRNPQPDPLFLLAGGPGQSAIETFPVVVNTAFLRINRQRDLVLLDQRGTGKSNPLECALPEEEDLSDEESIALMQACHRELDADARLYTTEIAVGDLERVREALGYQQINLYGASYGTRLAQAYLRRHPERVRALVLDSVVSPDFLVYENAGTDGAAALDKLFARCQDDEGCRETFPDLKEEFEALLERLDQEPIEVEVPNPTSGKTETLEMTRSRLTNMVFVSLYTPEMTALLPLNLHAAYRDNNFAPLVAQASSSDAGLYQGLLYAILCTEDIPYIETVNADTYFGDMSESLRQVCEAWPQGAYPPDQGEPLSSDVPVLLLSGEADPITPPRYAELLAQMLPNSRHLIAPGMGHGIAMRGCVPNLMADFIDSASPQDLDVACVQDIQPPPFFVNFAGPAP